MAPARGAAFAAAMRMVDRVHRHAAHRGLLAEPAVTAGLADDDVLLVRVGHRADRRPALGAHHAHLARGEAEQRVAGVAADQLDEGAGRARELAALARLHLDVVDDGADRDVAHRHGVARLDVDALARDDLVALLEALRRQDVGQLAVLVAHQRDEAAAVRIVFEAHDLGRHVELAALEVDDAVAPLVAAAAPALRDAAIVVAAALLALAFGQRLDRPALPQLAAIDDDQLALSGRGRLEAFECHRLRLPWSRRSSSP